MAAQKAKIPNARTERCFPFNVKSTKIRMKLPQLRVFYVSVVLGLVLFCTVNASKYSLFYVLYGHDLKKCSSSQDPINTLEPSTEQDLTTNFTELINSSFEIEQTPPKIVDDESKKAQEKLESVDKAQQTDQKPSTPPPIATFEEWTKEKLMHKDKKKRQQNGTDKRNDQINMKINESTQKMEEKSETPEHPKSEEPPKAEDKITITEKKVEATTSPPILPVIQPKRNYASKECGAKVIHSNEEAEHVKAVLNDRERDEYARNPCEKAKNKFIIIELCETIQPTLLEVANFELFSSGPREVQLSIAERYPTMEWHSIGIFVAEDTREMQSFNFQSPGIYAKFIKLDLLSHYGREHYCTLSTIRLSGISMVDEYEAEAISEQVQTEIPEREENVEESTMKPAAEVPEKKEEVVEEKEKTVEVPVIGKVVETLGKLGSVIIGRRELKDGEFWNDQEKRVIQNRSCFDQSNVRKSMENTTNYMCFLFGVRSKPHSVNSRGKSPRNAVKKSKMPRSCPSPAQRALLRAILTSKICPTAMNKPPEAVIERTIVVERKNESEVSIPEPETQKKEGKVEEVQAAPISTTVAPVTGSTAAPPPHQAQQNLAHQQAQQQFAKNLNSLPGTASTHKESVFMKLNKRLSALELNISLSTEYLNELSRRYVAHQEEYNKQRERDQGFLKQLVQQASQQMKTAYETQISGIKRDLDEITRKMRTISREYRQFDSFCQKAYSNFADYGPFERSLSVPEQSCVKREEENGIDINSKVMEMEAEFVDGNGTWSNMEVIAFVFLIQCLTIGVAILLVIIYTRTYAKEPFLPSKEPTPVPGERATSPSIDEIRRLVREELRRTPVTVPRLEGNERRRLKRPSRFSECDALETADFREALLSEPSNLTPLRRRRSTIQPAEVGSEEELMEMRGSTPSIVDSSLAGTSISSRRSSTDSMMEKNSSPEQQKVTSPPWLTVRNPKFKLKKKNNKKNV